MKTATTILGTLILTAIIGWQEWRIFQLDQRVDKASEVFSNLQVMISDTNRDLERVASNHKAKIESIESNVTAVQDALANQIIDKAFSEKLKGGQ